MDLCDVEGVMGESILCPIVDFSRLEMNGVPDLGENSPEDS